MNILDALRNEIDRNKELVEIYKTIPTGGFGKMMIERDIKLAEDAIAEQDTVQMLTSSPSFREGRMSRAQ